MDKVWPNDKASGSPIKNSEKLLQLNYEEKLQKACIKLGARFVEYRAETGSWVFKVEHFSKYGLDDSDEDDQLEMGKKHALKKYDQFVLNTSCFWGSTRSNITSVVQFHEICV